MKALPSKNRRRMIIVFSILTKTLILTCGSAICSVFLYLIYSQNYISIMYLCFVVFMMFIFNKQYSAEMDGKNTIALFGGIKIKYINVNSVKCFKTSEPPLSFGGFLITICMGNMLHYYTVSDIDGSIKKYAEENAIRREVTNFNEVYWMK